MSVTGLLEAGWPYAFPRNRVAFSYRGITYQSASWHQVDPTTTLRPDQLEEMTPLRLVHKPEVDLPADFPPIPIKQRVVDEIRVYAVKGQPVSQVIVRDACPADLAVDHYQLFQRVQP